ncbi:single-stranded-DNA-specific exonuclease RecJ [Paenibacillus selenitireducens]|uniref:Single-stranded-DNA-specific exonuclease RecJ n=1 Tax=Paenibacillus selenitireducens TaxID=1324314 RepID=A0A1T2XKP2_9BACL|nr:single-stranded-DNA-specific exonuclease RecJ [Paenibacillus selenitireducens]OPA80378.1 single-stranded-DNA-specific exonuclease RecJ [Paenibacillus selenitireducens]
MLHSKMKWLLKETPQQDQIQALADQLGVSPMLAQMLWVRGIQNVDQAKLFLHGNLDHLHDPMKLKGMAKAVGRIQQALASGEKIRVFGDYDADGISSTSLMIALLNQLGANFDTYIPHRTKEGYGLNLTAMDHALEHGVKLIVTVDTGISAVPQIAYANQLGIDVIVTDHHEPPEVLPDAFTLVNPKLPDCPYPFKGLAGVGVAFKLAQALLGRVPEELLEYVTLGTIADLMPLQGENRILVRQGLNRMRDSSNLGIRALFETAEIQLSQIGSTQVAFAMAPRINASGRLEHAQIAVQLLTTEDPKEAKELAQHLDALNRARQDLVEEIANEAVIQLEQKMQLSPDGRVPNVIILAGEDWNVGVIGIVASKILERHYRPTLILGIDPETGKCKGSARSIQGFDMYEALTECSDLLEHYGGHQAAAGLTVQRENIGAFEERMNQLADQWLTPEHYVASTEVDLECQLCDANLALIESLAMLEPFGMSNPAPRVMMKGLRVKDRRQLGQEKQHLKLTLSEGSTELDAIAFRSGELATLMADHAALDVLGELQVNEWNGRRKAQLLVQDMAVRHTQWFDGRGNRNPKRYIEETYSAWEQVASGSAADAEKQGIVACEDFWRRDPFSQEIDLEKFSLWVYDNEVGIRPASPAKNMDTVPYELGKLKSLYMVDVPDTMQVIDRILDQGNQLERIHALYADTIAPAERLTIPSREQFKRIYVEMRNEGSWPAAMKGNSFIYRLQKQTGLSQRTLDYVMAVFKELAFIVEHSGTISMNDQPQKADLTTAKAYQELEQRTEVEQQLVGSSSEQLSKRFQRRYYKS